MLPLHLSLNRLEQRLDDDPAPDCVHDLEGERPAVFGSRFTSNAAP